VTVSNGGSIDTSFGPLCFHLTEQHICRTTTKRIITFDLFLGERQHLGRRIPEEEQLCSFKLSFSSIFSSGMALISSITL
jgi:hypothetical protein